MPRSSQMDIASLISGEVTPALGGRSDTEEYPQFVQTLENVFVEKHGGIVRRGGTQFVHEASGDKVRLVPFIYSRTASYVMAFGDRIVQLYQNSDYVQNVGNVSIYLGDGSTTSFQYPYDFIVENTQATAGQTVFPYTFTLGVSDNYGVVQNGTELEETTDYTIDTVAKTVTLVVPANLDDIIQIFYGESAPEDIEVYLNGELQEVTTDYTVKPINTISNILPPFGTPAWDGDATSIGTSWTLPNDGTTTSPAGSQPIIRESDVSLTVGSTVEAFVTIDSVVLTPHQVVGSNAAVIPLVSGEPYIAIETLTLTADDLALNTVAGTFVVEDTSGNRASSFFWEIHYNDIKLTNAEGTEVAVTTPQTVTTPSFDLPTTLAVGDTIKLLARAVGEHLQSLPQISGDETATTLTADGVVNADPWLHMAARASGGGELANQIQLKDLTPGHRWQYGPGIDEVRDTQPVLLEFFTDKGAEVTLSEVFARNSKDGWKITFNTAPEAGDSVLIKVTTEVVPGVKSPIFEFASPFGSEELDLLYWAQANDVMLFCHEKHAPWQLTRTNHFDWQWTQPTMYGTPWDLPGTSWQADGTSADYDFFFDAAAKTDMEIFFNGKTQDPGTWDLKTGTAFPVVDRGTVTFTEIPYIGTTILITSKVSDYDAVTNGYPRCVTFFQERLWFAATIELPQTLWGSRVADFFDFAYKGNAQVLQPDDAVEYTIAAYTHESIEWLSSEVVLVVGTSSTEHRLSPDEYVATDRLPRVSKMTNYGGSHQMPMYMGGLTCFVQQSGRQLRSFQQKANMTIEDYESIELTWMANHMVKDMWIKEPYYALVPDNIAVMIREDGQLLSCMYDPSSGQMDAKEVAWSRQITDGTFKSTCVIPTDFGHQVWVAVKRVVDGVEQQYIELVSNDFFMDSAGFSDGTTSTDVLTGMEHLEGKTCDILVDGAVHPQRPVVNGEIQLEWAGTNIVAGLHYRPKIVTMPFTDGNPGGTGQGKPGRWSEIWVRLIDSAHPLINGKRPPVRHPITPMGEPEPNTTGAVRVFDTGYSFDKKITIEQDLPLRFQLVNIYGTFHIGTG